MPRRKVGFLESLVGDGVEGEEERMKTPTPTRTWGGWGGISFGFFVGFFFSCCAGGLVVCLLLERVVVVIFSCIWE